MNQPLQLGIEVSPAEPRQQDEEDAAAVQCRYGEQVQDAETGAQGGYQEEERAWSGLRLGLHDLGSDVCDPHGAVDLGARALREALKQLRQRADEEADLFNRHVERTAGAI